MGLKKEPIYDIFNEYIIGYECKSKNIKIKMCYKDQADNIIKQNHYSKKPTKNSFLNLIVLYHNKVAGALQIGYGIRPDKTGKYKKNEIAEFDRMWLSDEMPKFSETITLSLLHKFLKKRYKKLKCLISYSDTSVGNPGTIYKAANYQLIDSLPVDFYILPTGERIHPVTMWHRHKTRAKSFLDKQYPGWTKAKGKQLKFKYNIR